MRRILAAAAALTLTHTPLAGAQPRDCNHYHGRDYIICRESGPQWMPNGLPPGTPHPGPSSATGPCGMTAANRRAHHGDNLVACHRYMRARYGTWQRAEAKHRQAGWW
jgi:hypothetical protein